MCTMQLLNCTYCPNHVSLHPQHSSSKFTMVSVPVDDQQCLQAMKQLLHDKETSDPKGWAQSQQQIQTAKLQRTRLTRETEDLKTALVQAEADMSHGIDLPIISCHIL